LAREASQRARWKRRVLQAIKHQNNFPKTGAGFHHLVRLSNVCERKFRVNMGA